MNGEETQTNCTNDHRSWLIRDIGSHAHTPGSGSNTQTITPPHILTDHITHVWERKKEEKGGRREKEEDGGGRKRRIEEEGRRRRKEEEGGRTRKKSHTHSSTRSTDMGHEMILDDRTRG